MQCPNCGNETPNTADKCRICGATLDTPSSGLPGWTKDLLIGMSIGLVVFALLGAGYYFFFIQPSQSAPQPPETSTLTVAPPTTSTATEVVLETSTPTLAPSETPPPTEEAQHCDIFDGIDMTIVYLDWLKGEDLEFYIKMPGGVPGLEKKIAGASGEWVYRVKIGIYRSAQCEALAGYKERLYCHIDLPREYASSVRPISLQVNTCDEDIFKSPNAFLPEIKK